MPSDTQSLEALSPSAAIIADGRRSRSTSRATKKRRPGLAGLSSLATSRVSRFGQAAVATVALIWLCLHGASSLGYNWQWERVPDLLVEPTDAGWQAGTLLLGARVTVEVASIALVISTALGLAIAILRLSHSFVGRGGASVYVGLIRNTPLLIQLNLFYFIVAPVFDIGRLWTGILCVAVFEAAYASEIFRSGLLAVQKGQWEASASLGLDAVKTYRYVILPQAVRIMLPPLTSIAVSLIKDSAIVSVIAVPELTTAARNAISATFMSFEVWFTTAAIYLVFTLSLSAVGAALERALKKRLT
jgi:polar amino acid transport system permease protein